MLNLHARAAALQMVHAVVVFPGSSETERVKAAILLAERLKSLIRAPEKTSAERLKKQAPST